MEDTEISIQISLTYSLHPNTDMYYVWMKLISQSQEEQTYLGRVATHESSSQPIPTFSFSLSLMTHSFVQQKAWTTLVSLIWNSFISWMAGSALISREFWVWWSDKMWVVEKEGCDFVSKFKLSDSYSFFSSHQYTGRGLLNLGIKTAIPLLQSLPGPARTPRQIQHQVSRPTPGERRMKDSNLLTQLLRAIAADKTLSKRIEKRDELSLERIKKEIRVWSKRYHWDSFWLWNWNCSPVLILSRRVIQSWKSE